MIKTLNQKIYTYDSTKDASVIPSTALLDEFLTDYETAAASLDKRSHYTNLQSTLGYPNITGSIYIANQNGTAVNEEDISQVYNVVWPKLNIFVANVNESYVAKFVSRQDSGADTEIDIKRFGQTGDIPLTLANITNKIPTKTNHRFLGWALDAAGTQMVFNYQFNSSTNKWELVNGEYMGTSGATFSSSNTIITLYAIFEVEQYGIKFYDGDGTLLTESATPVTYISATGEVEAVTMLIPYGEKVRLPKKVAYKDDSELELEQIYVLKGWSITENGTIIKNLTNRTVTSNMVFYPIFEIDNVHNNVLPAEFISPRIVTSGTNTYAVIKLADGYTVRGKVTLPGSVVINGSTYRVDGVDNGNGLSNTSLNGFDYNPNITAIFWENGATPTQITAHSFRNCTSLKYFEFVDTITKIGDFAFAYNKSLQMCDFSHCHWQELGASAFYLAFALPTADTILFLPGSITIMGGLCFAYNGPSISNYPQGIGFTAIQIGDVGDPSLLSSEGNGGNK